MKFMEEVVATQMKQIKGILSKSFSNEDLEDAVQDVLLHMCETEGPADPAKLAGWVGQVTRNHAVTLIRRRNTGYNEDELTSYFTESYDEGSADPEDLVLRDELRSRIYRELSALPEHLSAVYPVLTGETTAVALAELRDESVDAVRKRVQRLRERLTSLRV